MNAEFVKALIAAGPEIHAVGLVVNIEERLSLNIQLMICLLRELKIDMKHVLVIFTHGDSLLPTPSSTELKRRCELRCKLLPQQIEGLECLRSLLVNVEERYIVVENLQLCERGIIVEQLFEHIDSIAADPMTNETFCTSLQWWKDRQANREKEESKLKDAKDKLAKLQNERAKTDLEKLRSKHRLLEDECSDLSNKLGRMDEMEKTLAEMQQIQYDTSQCIAYSAAIKEKLRKVNEGERALREQEDTLKGLKGNFMQNYEAQVQGFYTACTTVISNRDDGITTLENAAGEINTLKKRVTAAKVSGYSGSIIGAAIFTVGAGLSLFPITLLAGIPLLAIGGAVGAAGSITAIGGTVGQLVKKSKIMKRANLWLKENQVRSEVLINAHDKLTEEHHHIVELFPDINADLPPGIMQVGEIVNTWKVVVQHGGRHAMQVILMAAGGGFGVAQGVLEGIDIGAEAAAIAAKAAGGVAIGLSAFVIVLDLGLLIKSSIELDRVRKGHPTKAAQALMDLASAVRDENNLLRAAMCTTGSRIADDMAASIILSNPSVDNDEQLHSSLVDEPEPDSDHPDELHSTTGDHGSNEEIVGIDRDGDDESMVLLEAGEGEEPDEVYLSQSVDSIYRSRLNVQDEVDTQSDSDSSNDDFVPFIASDDTPKEDASDTRGGICVIS